jgi:hypothetical protein
MLIPARVWSALLEAGVDVVPSDARHAELRHGDRRARMAIHAPARPLNPSDIVALASRFEPGLLVLSAATRAARAAVDRAGWSWLVSDDRGVRGVLRIADARVEVGTVDAAPLLKQRTRPGRSPWGTLTVVRCLLGQPGVSQKSLASCARVSQPRVSQVLRTLLEQQLVRRVRGGWVVSDVDGIIDWWLERYPGPGGVGTYWYGLDAPSEQARTVVQWLADHASDDEPGVALSGDVAADMIAPWRSPHRVVIYARRGLDLAEVGLIPAGIGESTLEFVVPDDPGIWAGRSSAQSTPLADSLQILWDVYRTGGPDSDEAAGRLRAVLRAGWSAAADRSA